MFYKTNVLIFFVKVEKKELNVNQIVDNSILLRFIKSNWNRTFALK